MINDGNGKRTDRRENDIAMNSENPEKTIDWAEIARECSEALDWLEECLFSLTPLNKIVN